MLSTLKGSSVAYILLRSLKRKLKAVKDVVEESSKDRAPGVLGGLFLTLGKAGQKRKDHL